MFTDLGHSWLILNVFWRWSWVHITGAIAWITALYLKSLVNLLLIGIIAEMSKWANFTFRRVLTHVTNLDIAWPMTWKLTSFHSLSMDNSNVFCIVKNRARAIPLGLLPTRDRWREVGSTASLRSRWTWFWHLYLQSCQQLRERRQGIPCG